MEATTSGVVSSYSNFVIFLIGINEARGKVGLGFGQSRIVAANLNY